METHTRIKHITKPSTMIGFVLGKPDPGLSLESKVSSTRKNSVTE